MNTKSLSEVYSIINLMDENLVSRIPYKFIEYIKLNRDIFYEPEFKEIPENLEGLEHDTKVMLALIYKKYFKSLDTEYWDNYVKPDIDISNKKIEDSSIESKSNGVTIYKDSILDKIKNFVYKLKKWFLR